MKRLFGIAVVALLIAAPTFAQNVQYVSPVTRGHIPVWNTNGVIADGGSSASSPITSIGVTNNGGSGICVNSALPTTAGYQALCLGANTAGPATISLQNYGTAPAESLQFVINGTTYAFPGSLANITVGTTPVVGGTTGLCLYVSGGVVGQQNCTLSAITSLTGDVTATGPGSSAATLAAVNSNIGTFGSSLSVPVITVNGKGLITSVTTASFGLTVGSSVIASGTNNGLLYDNGGLLGNLATLGSGVLVTSAGGVPSIATTLPTGLTIPTPTFTGTLTFPDSATWTSNGISKVVALSVGSATIPSGGNVSISGLYMVNGTQIAASNLSNGATGSGAVVLAASPAISGTWTGSPTFSGNITFSGQAIATGTTAPASAGGNSVVMGTITSPTLSNNGQAFLYNTTVNGAIVEGAGSTNDVSIFNKSGALVLGVPTGTTKLNFPSLASGTCSSGLGLDASNNTVLVSCPGAASSIQVGTTTIASGTSPYLLYNNSGTLGNVGLPFGFQNCALSASVGSNLLTVNLLDAGGSNPSASSPCLIAFRNSTATTGSYNSTIDSVTSSLSISTNATGATLGSANATAFRFWVVAFDNAGTVVLSLFNATNPTAFACSAINEGVVQSSTGISGSATSTGVYYTPNGTSLSSKAIKIIGYVEYNSTGLVTAGTYASAPNFVQVFGPGIRKPCEPMQMVTAVNTTVDTGTTSTTYATNTNEEISITPSSAANPLIIEMPGSIQINAGNAQCDVTISRGVTSNTNIIGDIRSAFSASGGQSLWPVAAKAWDLPNTASSQTYAGQRRTTASTCIFPANSGVATTNKSLMQITEIMG